MRWDMDKVIVERPRYGSRLKARMKKGYARHTRRQGLEGSPRREPMIGRWRGKMRQLNEHLGPMRKFLRSRVGRPWNKVYQELCEHVALDNAVQNHVLSHIFQYVHRRVELRGEQVIDVLHRHWHWRGGVLRPGEMYVCPRSGLLKAVRPARRRRPVRRVCLRDGVQLLWRDNAWWEVRVRKVPSDPGALWDVWLERLVTRITDDERRQAFAGELFATSKRPLSREEVRALYRRLRKCVRRKPSGE